MNMDWAKFATIVAVTALLIGAGVMAAAQDEFRPANVCGHEPISTYNKDRLLICNQVNYNACRVLYPRESKDVNSDRETGRPLGHLWQDQRRLAMQEYQRSKNACRDARAAYDDDTAFLHQQDMAYWRARLAAAGAYGVELNEVYPWDGTDRVKESILLGIENVLILQVLYGLPNLDLFDTHGSED
jgi:hypothetical protein